MPTKIRLNGIGKDFRTRDGVFQALAPLDLELETGAFYTIVGPSGCGKTTLLRILGGLEDATTGELEITHSDSSAPLTSIIFQEDSIFPWMTVEQNIGYGLTNRGVSRKERDASVDHWLGVVGLTRFKRAFPHQLSGGMRQRVSVARAFANDPEVLLMDEPFSALDEQNRTLLQQELIRIWELSHKTVVFVTHSVDEALTLSDSILLMSASPGRILETIEVPFERPRDVLEIRAEPRYGVLQQRIWERLLHEVDAARTAQGERS